MSSKTHEKEGPSAIAPTSERIARMVIMGILGGIAAGLLVGGIGGRLIMRILVLNHFGNTGEITAGGTFAVIIAAGIFGVVGGLVYGLIRRWLPGGGLLKGIVFGLVLLCFFGTALLDPDNVLSPRLSVVLFALLFPLYGVVASLFIERFYRYVPPLFTRLPITVLGYLSIAGFGALGLYLSVVEINAIA